MSMRAKGEGCLYKKPNGRWEGRILIGHKEDGKPLYRFVSAKTQKEALRKLNRIKGDFKNINLSTNTQLTLEGWLDIWIRDVMKGAVKESTLKTYKSAIDSYIVPMIGDKLLYRITSTDIQKFYHKLKYEGRVKEHPEYGYELSDASVRGVHIVLHRAMRSAISARMIAYNPTEGVTIPKANYRPMRVLNEEQLDRFLDEIEKDPHWFDFFYTEITTGLRLGEITALMWDDFDYYKGTLNISRNIKFRDGKDYYMESPKTVASRRIIYLPASTANIIRERKEHALTEWIFYHPVCPERPISPKVALQQLKKILSAADLPSLRFHDLRHTFATHAIASGVDAKTLAGILGHTNASFTLDTYAHVTTDMQRQAAKHVGNFLEGILGKDLAPWERNIASTEKVDSGNEKMAVGKAV